MKVPLNLGHLKEENFIYKHLEGLAKYNKMSLDDKWNNLSANQQNDILYGNKDINILIDFRKI